MEQIKKQETNIVDRISNFKEAKNPMNVIFMLGDLKDIFISIGETLLSGIEGNYSQNARNEYFNIVKEYKQEGVYEAIYNYYINHHGVSKFRQAIDDYFEYSFFMDISFFFYTLSKHKKYDALFDIIKKFYLDTGIRSYFFSCESYLEKKEYLQSISEKVKKLETNKEIFTIIKFLNYFQDFPFEQLGTIKQNGNSLEIKVMKAITLFILKNKDSFPEIYEHIIDCFVYEREVYTSIIEDFEEKKIYDVISFLRKDILSGMYEQNILDYQTKKKINDILYDTQNIELKNIDEKISLFLNKEFFFSEMNEINANLARITLKRKVLEKKYSDMIDLTLGINSLPQDIFYLFKQKTVSLNIENLKLYTEIKDLILYMDKSLFLNICRPFLLKKISHYFNDNDGKYYIIKFILCVVLSSSYSEYKRVSKFFYNLECFFRNSKEAFFGRILQFGWLYIVGLILIFIAPFGVFLAGIILLTRIIVTKIISKINPKIKMNFNFQIGIFAGILATGTITLTSTFSLDDNINLIYNNYKQGINALILPTNESITLMSNHISQLTTNVIGVEKNEVGKKDEISIGFDDIDYRKSKGLFELKENSENISPKNNSGSSQIFEISEQENIFPSESEMIEVMQKIDTSLYSNVIIDKNRTFWDYGIEISSRCGKDITQENFNHKLYSTIELFLEQNRVKLSSYLPKGSKRMSVWEMASRLPEITFNLTGLEEMICKH